MWQAIIGFFQTVNLLLKLYKQLTYIFGDNLEKISNDLATQIDLIEQSKKEGVTIEQKRELRRQALRLGVGMFGRID
jgi:hypothetical protein